MSAYEIKRYNAKDGYLFYKNLGEIGSQYYWAAIRNNALHYFDQVEMSSVYGDDLNAIADQLEALGAAELANEKQALRDFFGCDINVDRTNYEVLIRAMNEALNIKEIWTRVIDSVESNSYNRGANFAAIYGDTLYTDIGNSIGAFLQSPEFEELLFKAFGEGDTNAETTIEEKITKIIYDTMDKTLTRVMKMPSKKGAKDSPYSAVLEAINATNDFRQTFKERFFSMYGFDEFSAELAQKWSASQAGVKDDAKKYAKALRKQVRTEYKSKLKTGQGGFSQQIAGYIAEEFAKAVTLAAAQNKSLKVDSRTTAELGATAASTDLVSIMQKEVADISISVSTAFDTTVNDQDFISQKGKAYVAMNRMIEQMKTNMDNALIVNESTKKYHLGDNFHGFKGTTYSYTAAVEMLNHIDLRGNGHDIQGFLNKIMNTRPGALLAGRSDIISEARHTLSTAVAHFLFDDWDTIGVDMANASVNVIHVFRLSDIVVPLSYVLLSMAQAMRKSYEEASRIAGVHFTSIRTPIAYNDYPYEDTSIKASHERWQDQRNRQIEEFSIQISFLEDFKKIVSTYLGTGILS